MGHAALGTYSVLAVVSVCCPHPEGRLFTCYSPVCHSILKRASSFRLFVRLACVKHAASVRPEPGSNSLFKVRLLSLTFFLHLNYCFSLYSQSSYHCLLFLVRVTLVATLLLYHYYFRLSTLFYLFFAFKPFKTYIMITYYYAAL